jgi:hypothetical protein
MLAVRTPGAPHTTRTDAACDSAFPLERQGRLLRSRSISGLYSRSLHSGLQPPCLRFATAVTGRHARLGSRLLARLCRGRHLRRQTSTRLQGATLPKPDVTVSVSSGFPVSSKTAERLWMIPNTVSAFRISRTSPFRFQDTCHPFPCERLSRPRSTTVAPSPCASRRGGRSHIPLVLDVSSAT